MRAEPAVTIVIPAHDAEGVVAECLQSVFDSAGVDFEVIVVDDASSDDTRRIVRQFPCRLIAVHDNIMAANCRNLGARHARGEFLAFFDSDQLAAPDTFRRYVEVLRARPEVDAVVGSLAPQTPAGGFFSKFKNLQHHYTHQTAEREGATLDSGRMAIRRSAFEALGGFEPAFAAASIEDIALGYRMTRAGRSIRFEPSIQVVHLKEYSLAGLIRSDIVDRAIPWTGLMLRERIFRNDLNTRSGNVLSVALAWVAMIAVGAAVAGLGAAWVVAAAAVLSIWVLNLGLLRATAHHLGTSSALKAAAFLPLMYLYQGAGLGAGLVAFVFGRSVATPRVHPEPEYDLFEPDAG